MRTLLITDLHLNSRVRGLLDAQCKCILNIFQEEKPQEVIIMGDVFMYRKPSPSELLAFKKILDRMVTAEVVVLRGNHDSETKADDGTTALSLYKKLGVVIITQTQTDHQRKRVYIPHYENEKTIISDLEMVPEDYTVFGHFGYAGSLNSAGDADFSIQLSNFNNPTFLGHVHSFCERQGGLRKPHPRVVCLGTPYTTNYGECFKDNFYAILDDGGPRTSKNTGWFDHKGNTFITEFKQAKSGPRHLVYQAQEVENNLNTINDPKYFTFLRVMVGADHYPIPYDKLKVAHVDVKYSPVFNEEEISTYTPERDLFSINDMIISDYVEEANSIIPIETLMEGYRLLQDEN